MKSITQSVVDIGLACPSWTMEKEALARLSIDSMYDLVKGRALVSIEFGNVSVCYLLLLSLIIISLLHDEVVSQKLSPIHLRQRHRRELFKRRALSFEQLFHQVETIVVDLLICRFRNSSVLEFVLQIITDMDMEAIPEILRLCGISTNENSDKERAERSWDPVCIAAASSRHWIHSLSSSKSPLAMQASLNEA